MASIRVKTHKDGSRYYQVRGRGIRTRSFNKHADAKLYRAEQERRAALGELYTAPAETFGDFLDGLIDRKAAGGRRGATLKVMRESRARLASLEDLPIPQLRRADLEDELAAIAKTAPRRAQMCRALAIAGLKAAQARGQRVDEGLFSIERPRYEEREARFLALGQVDELASWIPEYIRRIVPVASLTGMRQGELFDVDERDLELDAGVLQIRRGKTKAARRKVELAGEVVALLREQLLARPHGSTLVFPTPTGLRWDKNRFMERLFRPALLAAIKHTGDREYGRIEKLPDDRERVVDGIHFHDLRHTAVSLMALAGWRFEHVAVQVGWAPGSWSAMWARYRHLFEGEMQAQTAKLDELIRQHDRQAAQA